MDHASHKWGKTKNLLQQAGADAFKPTTDEQEAEQEEGDKKLDKMIDNARFAESKPLYEAFVKDMVQVAYDEVPRVPLFQPTMDVAMQKDVQGYQYWFHLQPDYRQLYKS